MLVTQQFELMNSKNTVSLNLLKSLNLVLDLVERYDLSDLLLLT